LPIASAERTLSTVAASPKATNAREVGRRIRLARIRAGKRQTGLAIEIGLADGGAVWRYEHGQVMPTGERLVKIADVLGVTPEWIMRGDEERSPGTPEPQPPEPAVELYLRDDPTAAVLPPAVVARLRLIRFGESAPSVGAVRALALALLDEVARDGEGLDDTTVRRQRTR
jgi:transcriptional regulator with XRE-family HTH domain